MKNNIQERKSKLSKILGYASPKKDVKLWRDLRKQESENPIIKSTDKYALMGFYLAGKYALPLGLLSYGAYELSKQF